MWNCWLGRCHSGRRFAEKEYSRAYYPPCCQHLGLAEQLVKRDAHEHRFHNPVAQQRSRGAGLWIFSVPSFLVSAWKAKTQKSAFQSPRAFSRDQRNLRGPELLPEWIPEPHLHQEFPAGQVVVMVREDIWKFLEHQHSVPVRRIKKTLTNEELGEGRHLRPCCSQHPWQPGGYADLADLGSSGREEQMKPMTLSCRVAFSKRWMCSAVCREGYFLNKCYNHKNGLSNWGVKLFNWDMLSSAS